jgi:hypothetical protein
LGKDKFGGENLWKRWDYGIVNGKIKDKSKKIKVRG